MKYNQQQITEFQEKLWDYYQQHRRDLPWRQAEPDGSIDPYKIMVSEVMLQQTQVPRVIPKYHEFLGLFPDVTSLSQAKLGEVLAVWSGLGYNRRAKYMHEAAKTIVNDYYGRFSTTLNMLIMLPGIGKNTAGAILAYAFNQPALFVETNIRTVFIHHFFGGRSDVSDSEILGLIQKTINTESPRDFYWALMDYGTYLKAVHGNASRRSKHYVKQSAFQGSKRQIRGQVIRLLTQQNYKIEDIAAVINDSRLSEVIDGLIAEKLVQKSADGTLSLFQS